MLPQLIYLGITLLGLGIALEQHGKPKEGTFNVWYSILSAAIGLWLLYWGGFFDVFLS